MNRIELRFLDAPHDCKVPRRQNPFETEMNPLKKLLLKLLVVSKKHPEHWKYLECENDILFERRRHILSKIWFVMHPFSILAGVCDLVMLVVYCIDEYHVPFRRKKDDHFTPLSTFTTTMMILNVVRQFFTGYIDKEYMVAVIDLKKTAWHYFRGCFFFDLIGVLPLYFITVSAMEAIGNLDDKTRSHCGFLRLTLVFSLRLFFNSLWLTMEYFNANATVKTILPWVIYSIVFLHWTGSMLVFIPNCVHGENLPNVSKSWLNIKTGNYEIKPIDESDTILYFRSIFRSAMLLFKLGFGTDYPRTIEDFLTSVALVLSGRILLFVLIERVLSVNKWVRSPRVRFLAQMRLVKGFLRHREVPQVTRKKVEMYFERQLGGTYFRESALLSLLSGSLREELREHELRALIRDSELLRRLPSGLAARVARSLKREIFLPNDVVMRIGSFGDCMYLIASGTVCIVLRSGYEVGHLEDGDFFGELEIVSTADRRTASCIAVEVCELYRLDRDDAMRYLRMAPELWTMLRNRAEEQMAIHHNESKIQSLRKQFDAFR